MQNSDDESDSNRETRSRSRSRSPIRSDDDHIDLDNLSPQSKKFKKIMEAVVTAQIAPIKRNINKLMDTSSQIKGFSEQNKKNLIDLRKSSSSIEESIKKSIKADPKSSLPSHAVTKLNGIVFENLKKGSKKDQIQTAVIDELLERGAVTAKDEDAVKAVAGTEFSHVKAHLRALISEDLSAGNDVELPKTSKYLRNHLKVATLEEETHQYLIIMALGAAKFENMRPVPLGEADKENKRRVEEHINNWWSWVQLKFVKYKEDGYTLEGKLRNIISGVGYQPKKNDGAVRRPT